jgi:hypothetical protein
MSKECGILRASQPRRPPRPNTEIVLLNVLIIALTSFTRQDRVAGLLALLGGTHRPKPLCKQVMPRAGNRAAALSAMMNAIHILTVYSRHIPLNSITTLVSLKGRHVPL